MRLHIIYVPGIGDDVGKVQSKLVKLWRFQGVESSTHVMPWLNESDYKASQARLYNRITELAANGRKVLLVGASAGGSVVLNTFFSNPEKILGVAMICPKLNNPDDIGQKIVTNNPTFVAYMADLQSVIPKLSDQQKAQTVTFYSPSDKIVPYEDSRIKGIRGLRLPALSHALAILFCISFGSRRLIKELKRIADSA